MQMDRLLVRHTMHWRVIPDPLFSTTGGQDYRNVLATVYFRPDHPPYAVVQIDILDDSLSEGNEQFTVQLKSYDLSIILVNDIAEIVIVDNDGQLHNISLHCLIKFLFVCSTTMSRIGEPN